VLSELLHHASRCAEVDPVRQNEALTWGALHQSARPRATEIDAVFHWCLDTLERWLGEDWPRVCDQAGGLPSELTASQVSLHGLAMLIDLAGALQMMGSGPGMGKLRRALRRSPKSETIASARCALRLAIAAFRSGLKPEPEHGEPPMDLLFTGEGVRLAIEIKTLRRTDLTIEIDRFLDALTMHLLIPMSSQDVVLVGEARSALDPTTTEALAERLVGAMGLVRLGLTSPVIWAGTNRFEVRAPQADERPGSRIAMPLEDLWRRTSSRILAAAGQMINSGATWLVIESLDNLWELTPWSRDTQVTRTHALANASRRLLADQPHVHGIVFTDGATHTNVGAGDEDSVAEPRSMFMRRRIDYVRTRQTIVVALSDIGASALPTWRSILDAEPGFAEWALPQFGLVAPPELTVSDSAQRRGLSG
jgi:hypothetical protein